MNKPIKKHFETVATERDGKRVVLATIEIKPPVQGVYPK